MNMTKAEFEALRQRVSQAYYQGYKVANTAEYVAALGGGAAPLDIEPFSTAHLYYLIQQIEAGTTVAPDAMAAVKAVVEASTLNTVTVEASMEEASTVSDAQVTVKKPKKKASA